MRFDNGRQLPVVDIYPASTPDFADVTKVDCHEGPIASQCCSCGIYPDNELPVRPR